MLRALRERLRAISEAPSVSSPLVVGQDGEDEALTILEGEMILESEHDERH